MFKELVRDYRMRTALTVMGIFLFALLLRLPYLSYPVNTVWDEVMYKTFILNTVHGAPFFVQHPPLPLLVFAGIVAPGNPSLTLATRADKKDISVSFGDFPYQKIRLFNAILGSFFPVIIFFIGLTLGYSRKEALVPALLVVIDGMFIQYSRLVLPDMMLWVTGFFGIFLLLLGLRCQKGFWKWVMCLLAGIFFGLSVSVKWTALGFLLAAGYVLLSKKALRFFVPMALSVFAAYALVFIAFIFTIHSGPIEAERSYYPRLEYIQKLSFPEDKTLSNIAHFFIDYHRAAFGINREPFYMERVVYTGSPYHWLLALAPFGFWGDDAGAKIVASGNLTSWRLAFLAVLVMIFVVLRGMFRRPEKLQEHESFLLAGYFLNYIPFLFIMFSRPMYLYHYGVSVIFAFLLIPAFFARAKARFSQDSMFWKVSYFIAAMIVGTALLSSPFTYGF